MEMIAIEELRELVNTIGRDAAFGIYEEEIESIRRQIEDELHVLAKSGGLGSERYFMILRVIRDWEDFLNVKHFPTHNIPAPLMMNAQIEPLQ